MSNFDGRRWTEEELRVLYTERLKGTPYRVIARSINRSTSACEKKYNQDAPDWSQYSFYDPDGEETRRVQLQSGLDKNAISVNNALEKFRVRADIIADTLAKAARKLPTAPPPVYVPNKDNKQRTAEHMGLIFSDLHIGHEHTLDDTGGISEYNIEIFHNRLNNLQKAITDIKELHSKLYKIPKLHIFSLGDIVEGANTAGAWSPVYISIPVYDQIMVGFRAISNFLYYMLTFFDEVEFYGLCGNHGRIAPSGDEKKYNNFDLICYDFLKMEFRDNPRIKFNTPKSWWMLEEIQNYKFLLVHGDDVKGKNPPISAFLDFERKMTGIIKQIPNYTLCGHFHNCSEYTSHNGKILMNGSFVGADVYSLTNCMAGTIAEQKLFGIHPKVGITWTYNVNLNHGRE